MLIAFTNWQACVPGTCRAFSVMMTYHFFTGCKCIIEGCSKSTSILCPNTMACRVVLEEATAFGKKGTQ